jgi:AcrR family transcriptional regulator
MKRDTPRPYRSPLREGQAETTSRCIVDAAIRVLERRPAALSIPAVAREAGVSVATVYKHYGDKAGLIDAVGDRLDRAAGLKPPPVESPAALARHVRETFPRLNGRHALMAPAFRTAEGEAFRKRQLAQRVAGVRSALDPLSAGMLPEDFESLASIIAVLCTSETLGLLEEQLGLTGEQAGESVAWAITRLCRQEPPE